MKNYFKTLFIMFLFIFAIGSGNKVFALETAWNPSDKGSGVTLSNNNFTTTFNNGYTVTNIRSNNYMTSGKWYCELKADSQCMFGVANDIFKINGDYFVSSNQLSYYGFDGTTYPKNSAYGSSYGKNDVISMAIDIDNKKIKFAKNGIWYNEIILPTWDKYYVYLGSGSSGNHNMTSTINFGDSAFVYNPPTGYLRYNNEVLSKILLNKSTDNLQVGQTDTLIPTLTSVNDATNENLIWTSSDSAIATVDSGGKVTALKEGRATITVQIKGSETKTTCTVNITNVVLPPNPVSSIVVDKSIMKLTMGDTEQLTATTTPAEPTDPTGNGIIYIEMVDGNVKQAQNAEVADFIKWFKNRDLDDNDNPIYKIKNAKEKVEYLVHDKVVAFEIR